MKISLKIKVFFISIFLMLLFPLPGCEDLLETLTLDCRYCYSEKPDYADIWAEVTLDDENPFVPITIYYGSYEEGNIAATDTAWNINFYVYLPVDESYTLVAKYKKEGLNYFVINGTKLRTRYDSETCLNPCYYVTGDEVDLRKKF